MRDAREPKSASHLSSLARDVTRQGDRDSWTRTMGRDLGTCTRDLECGADECRVKGSIRGHGDPARVPGPFLSPLQAKHLAGPRAAQARFVGVI